jgi:conjugative transfer signal peptidase TraF
MKRQCVCVNLAGVRCTRAAITDPENWCAPMYYDRLRQRCEYCFYCICSDFEDPVFRHPIAKHRGRVRLAWVFGVALAILGVLELTAAFGPRLAWPVSDSLPRGLYLFVPGDAQRGDVAHVCLPPTIASYAVKRGIEQPGGDCPNGLVPLGKVVAAVEGDVVDVEPDGVRVNGALWPQSQQKTYDLRGRRVDLRQPFGPQRLGPGLVWLMGRHRDSWDSRYFGAIARSALDGRFIPLIVKEKTS